MAIPQYPKIYHILHVDRLASVMTEGGLLSDAMVQQRGSPGTTIGMNTIKQRRLEKALNSYPSLTVGQCVPFYFCPRSIMLYVIAQANHSELSYRGGQGPIIHLECDLYASIEWAENENKRWAFTLSNAGSRYFEDKADISQLGAINWAAVASEKWGGPGVDSTLKEGKQAEFLLEQYFPWALVERIGVQSPSIYRQVSNLLSGHNHRPKLEVITEWYF